MDLVTPSPQLAQAWEADWPSYMPAERRAKAHRWEAFAVTDGAVEVGIVALIAEHDDETGWVADVWIVPERRRQGHGSRALALAETWARENGVTKLRAAADPGDAAHAARLRDFEPASRHMLLPLGEQPPNVATTLADVQMKPMKAEEFGPFVEQAIVSYARHAAGREPSDDEVAEARQKTTSFLPKGRETPHHEFVAMHADGRPVAYLWLFHDDDAEETFVFDVVVGESMRGRGYGRMIMNQAEANARAHGMKGVRLHVHENNPVAIKLYESLGYQTTARFLHRLLPTAGVGHR